MESRSCLIFQSFPEGPESEAHHEIQAVTPTEYIELQAPRELNARIIECDRKPPLSGSPC